MNQSCIHMCVCNWYTNIHMCVCVYIYTSEKAMAPHSSTLACKIPWTEEPGRLQSMESPRVRHDWVTSLSYIGEGNGSPLQCSCLENSRDRGAWWTAIYGVAQSRTRLTWLSSSSSSIEVVILFLFFKLLVWWVIILVFKYWKYLTCQR